MRQPVKTERQLIIDRYWTVYWYDYPIDALPDDPDNAEQTMNGVTHPSRREIHIYDGDPQTLVHEYFEAIKAVRNLELPHDVLEELEMGLAGICRANKVTLTFHD